MNDVVENRRTNFRRLVLDFHGPREAAIKLDMNESQISQLISPNIRKTMGYQLARNIEKAAKLQPFSLDMPTSPDGRTFISVPAITAEQAENAEGKKVFPHDESLVTMRVVWDNTNPYIPKGPLAAMYVSDNALEGICGEGDLCIFDCWPTKAKPKSIKPGSIVAAVISGKTYIRIIRESTEGGWDLLATSDLWAPMHIKDLVPVRGVLVEVRWLKPRSPLAGR